MKENTTTKPTKKKKLLFWLILAACILIIAAITLGVVFGVRGGKVNPDLGDGGQSDVNDLPPQSDAPSGGGEEQNKPQDEGQKPDVPVDTSSQYEFIVPIRDVSLIKTHEFCWDKTMKWYKLHEAMDFSAPAGTDVLAAVDGTVKSIVTDDVLDYATITIEHAGGVTTVYKFIDPDANLAAGSKVNRGQVIATVAAASGVENQDGDHLHFEVLKDGKYADPDDYLNINSK